MFSPASMSTHPGFLWTLPNSILSLPFSNTSSLFRRIKCWWVASHSLAPAPRCPKLFENFTKIMLLLASKIFLGYSRCLHKNICCSKWCIPGTYFPEWFQVCWDPCTYVSKMYENSFMCIKVSEDTEKYVANVFAFWCISFWIPYI